MSNAGAVNKNGKEQGAPGLRNVPVVACHTALSFGVVGTGAGESNRVSKMRVYCLRTCQKPIRYTSRLAEGATGGTSWVLRDPIPTECNLHNPGMQAENLEDAVLDHE